MEIHVQPQHHEPWLQLQRPRDINHNAEFIFRALINRGILAKNKANAKTSHKITSGVGKIAIKAVINQFIRKSQEASVC